MSVKANVISNYIGQISIAVLNFIFIPTYIKYIGVEAYGLVGMFAVLQIALNTFDGFVIPLISREMSCYIGGKKSLESLRNLLRTVEVICFIIGLIFVTIVIFSADFFANNWFVVEKLPKDIVADAIVIAVFVVALRALEDLYKGVLIGLQEQVSLNIINVLCSIVRFVGVIYALKYYEASIKTFYYWQLLSSILTTFTFIVFCYKKIPGMLRYARFRIEEVKSNLEFSVGSFSNAFATFINSQTDKIIISKLLPLSQVGYYTLSSSIVNVLVMIANPVIFAFYPKLITLRSQENHELASDNFHISSQIINLTCGVAVCSLIFYGKFIIGFWTQNPDLTSNIMPYVKLLSLGTLLYVNSCLNMLIPYIAGKPIVSARITIFGILLIFISTLPLIILFNGIGAAYGNIIQNLCILLAFPFCFNCYLKTEQKKWFFKDFFIPNLVIAILFYGSSWLNLVKDSTLKDVIICVFIAIAILGISSFACDKLRVKIRSFCHF